MSLAISTCASRARHPIDPNASGGAIVLACAVRLPRSIGRLHLASLDPCAVPTSIATSSMIKTISTGLWRRCAGPGKSAELRRPRYVLARDEGRNHHHDLGRNRSLCATDETEPTSWELQRWLGVPRGAVSGGTLVIFEQNRDG
jgi:hypothetical protein